MSDPATSLSTVTVTGPRTSVPDDITLTVAGQAIAGWTDVRITRGCETATNTFELGLTSSNPNGSPVVAQAGQAAVVKIGRDTVVTGWIDRDTNAGDARSHALSIVGRGYCSDLVDCAAEWKGGQISGDTALQVAAKLAEPYEKISVYAAAGADLGPAIPQFNLNFGETAWELIERVTRYAGLLAYEDELGNLVLSQVGQTKAASGAVYGANVQAWSVANAMDERYSDYVCSLLSLDTMGDVGDGGLLYDTEHDPAVIRHRLMYLVTEQIAGGQDLCIRRAKWEAARRFGRGTAVNVTVDSWRDSGGSLWTPNTLAPVQVPGLRYGGAQPVLCISQVTYRYGEGGGTLADLVLMPREAFALEPLVIQPTPFATNELTPPSP